MKFTSEALSTRSNAQSFALLFALSTSASETAVASLSFLTSFAGVVIPKRFGGGNLGSGTSGKMGCSQPVKMKAVVITLLKVSSLLTLPCVLCLRNQAGLEASFSQVGIDGAP
ncbi:hypothetical protein P167DRAFT_537043 [Morchella conica CCBAS932]|uniref:Uncharacterized protein n=1 Tax=Morchella conica CCBAS932 TaxID=1392247 RepID=A0A3N4KKD2_9PEZI|nr:hypothetical protein P167DRAFT_537043 [Morchella conica CCBAS932]